MMPSQDTGSNEAGEEDGEEEEAEEGPGEDRTGGRPTERWGRGTSAGWKDNPPLLPAKHPHS